MTLKTCSIDEPKLMPHVFTALGLVMLSSVLNSDLAVKMNIEVMEVKYPDIFYSINKY